MKEQDYAVIVFVGQRTAQGKIRGWHTDLTISAQSTKNAVEKASKMLVSDSHVWGLSKPRKPRKKKEE